MKNQSRVYSPEEAMTLALEEARKGLGSVAPNPPVGCIILNRQGQLIGKGHHKKCGGPHAEIDALNSVVDRAELKDATLFVTLEPCSHFGRTPPCADKIASLPIKKVVVGIQDPNPLVAGQGILKLQKSGIEVDLWPKEKEAEFAELIEVFKINILEKRAFVAMKCGMSLDGMLAEKSFKSQWITGEKSREEVHHLRGHYHAVLIGSNTVTQDNPSLNIRCGPLAGNENKAIVLDPTGSLTNQISKFKVAKYRSSKNLFQVVSDQTKLSEEVEFTQIQMPLVNGEFDLCELSKNLFKLGVCSVFVEGGAQVFSSFLQQMASDRLYLFIAPLVLGNESGISWSKSFSSGGLDQAPLVENPQVRTLGVDTLITGRLKYRHS